MDKECVGGWPVDMPCAGDYVLAVEICIDKVESQTINYDYSHCRQLLAVSFFPNQTCMVPSVPEQRGSPCL